MPTVNEPETIIEAQPFYLALYLALGGSEPAGLRVCGLVLPVPSYIERS